MLLITQLEKAIMVEVAPYWNVNATLINDLAKGDEVEVAPYWNVN